MERPRTMFGPLRVSIACCVSGLAVLGAVAASLSRPEAMIERSYTAAFDAIEGETAGPRAALVRGFDSAHLHLSRLPAAVENAPPLKPGDRITLQRSGALVTFEVLDVRPLPAVTLAEAGTALPPMLVVTATSTDQLPVQTVRLMIEAGQRPHETAAPKPHAL